MFWRKFILSAAILTAASSAVQASEFGRPASPEEIELWDIDVRPDGQGLPAGAGTVAQGKVIFEQKCAACHGEGGQGGIKDRLVGGQGTLASARPVKTVGSFWPYATTLFDYIRRAMPYPAPGSLKSDETYAVTAYILDLNGIMPANATLSKDNLAQVRMPNREGFVPEVTYTNIRNSR
ncbi:c-type cytochrome [Methylobacterium sp. NEAU K]|uniref:c-type cytochrome n=1 Tax=Methylobacterium sp. NEAU K TaxID=3064946 RepID=UPI00273661A0|nr:cytochrome c [Methylobacterium sp. NEAU K]MDP4004787.1 cytochrome c [Methylobacterium sp. NEAU K]